jgi:hypothetical protein
MQRRRSRPPSTEDNIASEKAKLEAKIAGLEAQLAFLKERPPNRCTPQSGHAVGTSSHINNSFHRRHHNLRSNGRLGWLPLHQTNKDSASG